ncbi:MAG: hypothetical protein MI919_15330, partial [Holophagales bacterium]|nr:hypothetical protein [Holophagales bacterium]
SHGNFPYRPWMHTSGLDVLRLSVDGAFEESYRRYRVGGSLGTALRLMADVRDARAKNPESPLRIEWKYILFEWNDSDAELRRARELADELEVRLRFCLTHTPGRSHRFTDPASLAAAIEELAPGAGIETTFQLRTEASDADSRDVWAEHVESLLLSALARLRQGDRRGAEHHIGEALRHDPGDGEGGPGLDPSLVGESGAGPDGRGLWGRTLDRVLEQARFPGTVVALANLAVSEGRPRAAERLFRRYLEMAPGAPDRETIEAEILELAIGRHLESGSRVNGPGEAPQDGSVPEDGRRAEPWHGLRSPWAAALARDPWGEGTRAVVNTCPSPGVASALASLALGRRQQRAAEALFRRYLELAPEAADRDEVSAVALELAVGNRLGRHVDQAADATPEARRDAERAALAFEPALRGLSQAPRRRIEGARARIAEIANPRVLLQLAKIRRGDGDLATALRWARGAAERGEGPVAEMAGSLAVALAGARDRPEDGRKARRSSGGRRRGWWMGL